jgi:dephospho-CoA kinase
MNPDSLQFGLTGGIASGKSTVARMFEELGAKIIDADALGHEMLEPGTPTHAEIARRFPSAVREGRIERAALGALVFADPAKLRELNAVLHPAIIARSAQIAAAYHADAPHAVVIVDAALIYEAGIAGHFRKIIVAWCRPEQQLERLMAKTGLSRAEAERRIASQMPADQKRRRADYVIDCSGTLDQTREQVERLYPELERLAL